MKDVILFDFDGVIADTFDMAVEVFNRMYPGTNDDILRTAFEGNINAWMKLQATENKEYNGSMDFPEEYRLAMKERATLFPEISQVLKNISQKYTLIIISSNMSKNVQDFLERNNLSDYFTEILGTEIHMGKVEKINMIMEKYAVTSSECIFVTDTLGDLHEPEKAGIEAVGVTWGFHDKERLEKGKSFKIIEHVGELEDAIEKYFSKRS